MAAVTFLSLTVVSFRAVEACWNSPMQKPILIWVPAFAILAMALAVAGMLPVPQPDAPAAEQRADR